MRVEVLGSGGAVLIPRPACGCRVCADARARGAPYARTCPTFTDVEEVDGLLHGDLAEVAARHGGGSELAYDGMVLEV